MDDAEPLENPRHLAPMPIEPRFLLLQIRDADDPVRHQEIDCFLRSLRCHPDQLDVHSLLEGAPASATEQRAQVVLIGGSGRYSAIGESDWLLRTLDLLRDLHSRSRPVFASCWGFQAMARALGGRVERDPQRAELGTLAVRLTAEGIRDPLFGPLGHEFPAHMGHEDSVTSLPADALSLAFSDRSDHQAFCFPGRPSTALSFIQNWIGLVCWRGCKPIQSTSSESPAFRCPFSPNVAWKRARRTA